MAFVDYYTVITPIYQTLAADATLLQNNYLNGAGKVHISSSRPQNATNPCLALRMRSVLRPQGENETFLFEWFLELVLYLDDFVAPIPDVERAANIDIRLFNLLNDKFFTGGSNKIYATIETNFGSPFKDPLAIGESFWIARYNLTAK